MSNATAIAAVTGALCTLFNKISSLESAIADLKVTAVPPDQAGTDTGHTSLNVFLYQVAPNPAWRNMNAPRQLPPGAAASPAPEVPPVALDLNYLITAYGKDNDDTLAHVALASAVSLLADNACLSPQLIQQATVNSAITGIDLHRQMERVRVTPKSLGVEEISKLWTVFQAKYRISVSYQVSVVLIDGAQPSRAPLPVLGYNIGAAPGGSSLPMLTAAAPASGLPSAVLGDTVLISGSALDGSNDNLAVLFLSPLTSTPLAPASIGARAGTSVSVALPSDAAAQAAWPAGPYLITLRRDDPPAAGGGVTQTRTSNAVPLMLAPRIVAIHAPATPRTATSAISVQCSPAVWPQQRASLIVGDAEIPAAALTAPSTTLSFAAGSLPAGQYFVRLRVDGVDSLLVSPAATPPAFDTAQQVTLP